MGLTASVLREAPSTLRMEAATMRSLWYKTNEKQMRHPNFLQRAMAPRRYYGVIFTVVGVFFAYKIVQSFEDDADDSAITARTVELMSQGLTQMQKPPTPEARAAALQQRL